jgi:hypothetical protein
MYIKAKLDLKGLTDLQFIQKGNGIVAAMTGNANFATPSPALATITTAMTSMQSAITQRDALLSQAQELTVAIGAIRANATTILNKEVEYVEGIANDSTDPEKPPGSIIESAGMDVAQNNTTRVGEMPQVTGLFGTGGDGDGEIDLAWNRITRGLKSYVIQISEGATAPGAWNQLAVCTKSKFTAEGLTSGTRYWFRVAAVGTAGQGPWSNAATKIAP